MNSIRIHPVAAGLVLVGVALLSVARGQQPQQAIRITPEQSEILSHMSIVYLNDGQGGQAKTIRFTGVNVQVVNGLGSTESTNGVGNMIVGYQELGNEVDPNVRTGSHYLVVGRRNNYTSYGGIVAGESNRSYAQYASLYGGRRNLADGRWSCVTGGGFNRASTDQAVAVGGTFNWSGSGSTVVVGGSGNWAIPAGGGGAGNEAVVVGGFDNRSKGQGSVIVGGRFNETTANYSAMLAGANNNCVGDAGGGGSYCAIVGGENNSTDTVTAATVGGGFGRSASGDHDWVAGSLLEDD